MFFACSNSSRFYSAGTTINNFCSYRKSLLFLFVLLLQSSFQTLLLMRDLCAREFHAHRRYVGVTLAKGKPDVERYALLSVAHTHFSQNSVRNRNRFSYTGMLNLIPPKIAESFFSRSLTLPKIEDDFAPLENKNKFCYLNSPTC